MSCKKGTRQTKHTTSAFTKGGTTRYLNWRRMGDKITGFFGAAELKIGQTVTDSRGRSYVKAPDGSLRRLKQTCE